MLSDRLFSVSILGCFLLTACSGDPDKTVKPDPNVPADLKSLNELIVKEPKNAEHYYNRSQYYFKKEEITPAIQDIQKALELDSNIAKYHVAMGDYHFVINQTKITITSLRKAVLLEPENTSVLLKLGELFYIVQKYDSAIFYVNRSLNLEPVNARANFQKGMILKEAGDTANAILAFQTAVDQDQKYYDAFIQLGRLHATQKNRIAIGYYDNALSLDPRSVEALYLRGVFLQTLNEYDKALENYTKLLLIDSTHVYTWYNLGYVEFTRNKDYKKAQKLFDKSFQLDPQYADAVYMRGICSEKLKDNQSAARDFNAAIIIYPGHEKALEGLKRLKGKK